MLERHSTASNGGERLDEYGCSYLFAALLMLYCTQQGAERASAIAEATRQPIVALGRHVAPPTPSNSGRSMPVDLLKMVRRLLLLKRVDL